MRTRISGRRVIVCIPMRLLLDSLSICFYILSFPPSRSRSLSVSQSENTATTRGPTIVENGVKVHCPPICISAKYIYMRIARPPYATASNSPPPSRYLSCTCSPNGGRGVYSHIDNNKFGSVDLCSSRKSSISQLDFIYIIGSRFDAEHRMICSPSLARC